MKIITFKQLSHVKILWVMLKSVKNKEIYLILIIKYSQNLLALLMIIHPLMNHCKVLKNNFIKNNKIFFPPEILKKAVAAKKIHNKFTQNKILKVK